MPNNLKFAYFLSEVKRFNLQQRGRADVKQFKKQIERTPSRSSLPTFFQESRLTKGENVIIFNVPQKCGIIKIRF
jgi:hypothetical protein